jgi:anaerobic selenocysteine-containing dehydrogenase
MVSLDIYLNETTRHADVILPGLSPLEDMHYDVPFPQMSWRNHARYSTSIFDAPAGQPPEWATLLKLAAIVQGRGSQADPLQLDDEAFAAEVAKQFGQHAQAVLQATAHLKGPERQLDVALRMGPYGDQFGRKPDGLNLAKVQAAPGGIDLGELQPRLPELLRTANGKIDLAPAALLADLQRPAQDLARPATPLVVVGRRDVRSNNSWMHNLPLLAKGPELCTALVHPRDAQQLGLVDGGMARITGPSGSVEARVELSEAMMPGVVSLPHGFGHDMPGTQLQVASRRPGANLNALLGDRQRDPLSGNAVLSGVAVELQPV